ncbi:MAG: metallophosphoesterase family protein [Candidatus Dormibacteraceae bacterium]
MRIAALYDIHGNLPALDAVLEELRAVEPDLIVLGGDVVLGPMPAQVLDRLAPLADRLRAIRGNCDREVLEPGDDAELRWVADRLTATQRVVLEGWPPLLDLRIGDRKVLFCHATPGDDLSVFTPQSPDERVRDLFRRASADLVVCGHTHVQFEHRIDGMTIVNAGSVGMPYEDEPGAYWLLLDERGHEFRHTAYDMGAAADVTAVSGYPGAWFEENLRRMPSREEALQAFEERARA